MFEKLLYFCSTRESYYTLFAIPLLSDICNIVILITITYNMILTCNVGESFCAMWYRADIAFMLKYGGLRSASSMQVMPRDHTSTCHKNTKIMTYLLILLK